MRTSVALFTRDLRIRDNPVLAAACAASDRVVPLFVVDPSLAGRSPNRDRFLVQSLADLREELYRRGGDLIVRHGDPVAEAIAVADRTGAGSIMVSRDVSRYADRRQRRLRAEATRHRMSVHLLDSVTVLPPGDLRPGSGDHYKVFTPYLRAWLAARWRDEAVVPRRITLPARAGDLSAGVPDAGRGTSPALPPGGEAAGRRLLRRWLRRVDRYDDLHDDLAAGGTSRLSPYLRFGCLSALEVARSALAAGDVGREAGGPEGGGGGARAFVRQLCWRDFYYQLAAAFPDLAGTAYRSSVPDSWGHDPRALAAWQEGRTGVPIVDAGLRQLREEGWMHNRARLVTASFLTRHLGLDWREGGRWFARWLVDGDLPNNFGNWQWVAGTGTDTRPYRRFNPVRQAHRYDPDGGYVRRYVPELASVGGAAVHEPWLLSPVRRRTLDYPPPLGPAGEPVRWLPGG